MRGVEVAGSAVLVLCVVLGLALPSAGNGATVEPNDIWADAVTSYFSVSDVYSVDFTWSSDLPLVLSVSGPSGLIHSYEAATSGSGNHKTDDGTLFFTWVNPNSVNATLTYELRAVTQSEHAASMFLWMMIGVAAIVIAVIIIVVFVVLKSFERSRGSLFPSQNPPMNQPYNPPQSTGFHMDKCPGCGSTVNPSTRICPGCGARVL